MSCKGSKFESCIEDFQRTVKVQCLDASQTCKEIKINIKRGNGIEIKSVNEIKEFLINITAEKVDPNDYNMIGVKDGNSEEMEDKSPIIQYDLFLCHRRSHIKFEKKVKDDPQD